MKNAGTTYERLINEVLANQIGKTIEAYVDDMLVKSKQVKDHISDLEEVFPTLQRHNMKLNPTKCVFRVASRKVLGFMIMHRGIEANPNKIQAMKSMESPKNKREIQKP